MITKFKMVFKREGDRAVINGYIKDDELPGSKFVLKNMSVDTEIVDFSKPPDSLRFIKAELINCIDTIADAYKNKISF